MAYLQKDQRRNPETGRIETRWKIAEYFRGGRVTGQIGFVGEEEAKRLLKIYEGRRAQGESPEAIWQREWTRAPEPAAPALPELTMAMLYDRYMIALVASGAATATVESAGYSWKAWQSHLQHLHPSHITRAKIDAILAGWRDDYMDRTLQMRVQVLQRILRLAGEDKLLDQLPAIRVPKVRETRPHRWLDPDEQQRLLEVLPWTTAPGSAWAIWLCLQLGLRIGEALSRTWGHVRWQQELLVVEAEGNWEVKTRTTRSIPLASNVLAFMRERAGKKNELICQGVQDIRSALCTACRKAEVEEMHPHALRHSWASRLAMAGVDRPTLMALGGWESGELLDEIYAHAHTKHIRNQVEQTALVTPTAPPNVIKVAFGRKRA